MITCVELAVVAIGVIGYFGYNAYRINLITNMTFLGDKKLFKVKELANENLSRCR